VRRLRQRATDHPVTFVPPGADLGSASLDPGMVGLVLDHLLDNAVRHTPAGTPVRVAVEGAPDVVAVSVADAGPGVPAEMLAHLFERFYRGDTARGRGGAGLGLTVAAAIVQAHGGSMHAAQAPPTGLHVTVRLPRHGPARANA
jgi:signal transduction histidine kinase